MADRYTRRINLYINDKEVRNDIASIRKEMTKMQQAQNRMIIGSKEYVAQGKRIAMLRGIMNKHQADLRTTKQGWFSLSKAADKANKYMTAAMAVTGTIVAIAMGFRKASAAAMEFEERLDNLSALTGLEGRQLEWLGNTAKKTSVAITDSGIRIKQSASDIVDAYTKVGSQRPELLKNKEDLHDVTQNAIILSEAAKSDLMPAVKGLTMAMNQHNLGAAESTRIINSMAAGSKLGAADIPYLTAAIEKSGTTLNLMNLSLEDNIALIETVAPSYSQASEAGNSLDKTFLMMKAQQIGFKDGVFDVSTALEELKARFDGGESSVDLFGMRHAKMAEILVKNKAEFKKYRDGVSDTDVAFEQAAKNTDNNATKLAQAQNKMKLVLIEFGETVNPVFLKSTNLVTYLIKALVKMPKFLRDNQIVLISLASALMAYNAALIVSIAVQIKKNIVNKAELMWNAALVTASTLRVAAMKIQILFLRQKTAAQVANVAALKKAIVYEQLFGKALMANPIGLAIAAFGLLVVAIKGYDKFSKQAVAREEEKRVAVEELSEAQKLLSETYDGVSKQMSSLNKLSIQEKKDLQDKIDKTIEQAEAELLLQEAKQKEIQAHNSQASLWQRTVNVFKSAGNAYVAMGLNAVNGAENGIAAAATMSDGIDALKDRINNFKQSGATLYDILNAEDIADAIGTGTLVELEEKLSTYQTAIKNLQVGTQDYIRVQEKITGVEKHIQTARAKTATVSEDQLKRQIELLTSNHTLKLAMIKKQHLEGKITEDQYNAQLLKQELKFLRDKMKIHELGSIEYAKAYNESLTKQVEADQKIKDLTLNAQQVLADAHIANFEQGLEKEIALQNRKWDKEKEKLENQIIEKEKLSQKEIELNDIIFQTIEEKTAEHLQNIKQLKEAANITELENMVIATEPMDQNVIELEQMQLHFDAKQNLTDAQYEREKQLAGNNQAALLAAEANYNKKSLANKNALIDAEYDLSQTKLNTAQGYISALAGIFSQETAMGKALFLFNQGLAIADIWINTAKANAKAVAASPLTFGQPWVAANTIQAGLSTGLVLAQTIGKMAKFAGGGFTHGEQIFIAGEEGTEWIAPNWMMENPSTAALISILEKARTNKISASEAAIPQFASGGSSSTSSSSEFSPWGDAQGRGANNDNQHYHQILEELTLEIRELRKYRPTVAVETIEKEMNNYSNIKISSGL